MIAALLIAYAASAAEVDLTDILADPKAYEGKSVTTCGLVTNGFEDSNLTLPDRKDGLGVVWCKGAPKQMKPVQGCVSGTLFPADPIYRDKGNSVEVTLDNSSAYPWRIRQSCKP